MMEFVCEIAFGQLYPVHSLALQMCCMSWVHALSTLLIDDTHLLLSLLIKLRLDLLGYVVAICLSLAGISLLQITRSVRTCCGGFIADRHLRKPILSML